MGRRAKKRILIRTNYKYCVINRLGITEPFTGIFSSSKAAKDWYKIHGKFWENLGYKLQLKVADVIVKV